MTSMDEPTTLSTIPRNPDDPRFVVVQVQARLPWFYKHQLAKEAKRQGVGLPTLMLAAIESVYPPQIPR